MNISVQIIIKKLGPEAKLTYLRTPSDSGFRRSLAPDDVPVIWGWDPQTPVIESTVANFSFISGWEF